MKAYHSRRKVLREYNEAATTSEDALIFGMITTSGKPILGNHTPTLGPEAYLMIRENSTFWSATPTHPYYLAVLMVVRFVNRRRRRVTGAVLRTEPRDSDPREGSRRSALGSDKSYK